MAYDFGNIRWWSINPFENLSWFEVVNEKHGSEVGWGKSGTFSGSIKPLSEKWP